MSEQKQVIVRRAVTQGGDPNVGLKPSGIPWLGDVPARWEITRLRYLGTKFGSGVTPRGGSTVYRTAGVPFLRSQDVHFDGLRLDPVAHISPELHDAMPNTHLLPNDVLLNITGASIGRACVVPQFLEQGNVNQHVCIIRPKANVLNAAFLAAYLSTDFMQREIRFEQNGASREGLDLDSIRSMTILLPSLEVQKRICEQIAKETEKLSAAFRMIEREIALLEEFRTSLIADVVTGKLDVGAAAAGLPEITEEPINEPSEDEDLDDATTVDPSESAEAAA
jgi:type I restriction enzyme, S subunit